MAAALAVTAHWRVGRVCESVLAALQFGATCRILVPMLAQLYSQRSWNETGAHLVPNANR